MPTTEQLRNRLLKKLLELFQLDQPDLDFGFYRIMHAKAQEVKDFLSNDLLDTVTDAFGGVDESQKAELLDAYERAIQTAKEYGVAKPEEAEPVKKAKLALDAIKDTASAEADVYDHLYRFFERYYDDGDFISRRYYTRESSGRAAPFAVPYNGEEVKLHWANADQYYIKSTEYFSNFTFDLRQSKGGNVLYEGQIDIPLNEQRQSPLMVHFRVVEATEGEHGNVKASDANKRFFILHDDNPVTFNDEGELVINFEYRPDPEKTGTDSTWREKRNIETVDSILERLQAMSKEDAEHEERIKEYGDLLNVSADTESDNKLTVLAKYVNRYTARNTMDYFIHKDLGGFLRRELDFYIKNEVMRLDDIEDADAPVVEEYLSKIKVLRQIAGKLIDFLAQLENFQKKLWLKKKFVIETNYCITLDRVPEELYEQIATNDAQREEWVRLFAIDEIEEDLCTPGFTQPLTIEFLKANDKLVLDTRFFDEQFKAHLLASIDDFDEQCNGILINGDNFQGMALISDRYDRQVRLVYIDPPYNTGDDDFIYKDSYQHSSWLSFIKNRISVSIPFLRKDYNYLSSIDDEESARLRLLLEELLSHDNFVSDVAYERSGSSGLGQGGKIVNTKEHILVYSAEKSALNDIQYEREIEFETLKRYNKILTDFGNRKLENTFVAPSTGTDVKIFRHEDFKIDTISLRNFDERKEEINNEYTSNFDLVFRLTSIQRENEFQNRILSYCKDGLYSADYLVSRGRFEGHYITAYYFNQSIVVWLHDSAKLDGKVIFKGNKITDHWSHGEIPKADLANEGGVTLSRGKKPEQLMKRLIEWCSNENELVLDYFAGSGSTAAVALKLKRKFIVIDAEKYFQDKCVRRIKNVLWGEKTGISKQTRWSGGGLCKYFHLESYEDTLNNLRFTSNPNRKSSFAVNDSLKEDYMLRYMLDVETQGSQSLLNIDAFSDPTSYTLDVKKPGSDEYTTKAVDLIETFNYLIGLHVMHTSVPEMFQATFTRDIDPELPMGQKTRLVIDELVKNDDGPYWFRTVEGWVPKDSKNSNNSQQERVLVIWRKLTGDIEQDNVVLDEWFAQLRKNNPHVEIDTIYVNGSNNIANHRPDEERWRVRLIEEEFMKRMWTVDNN